MDKDYQLDVFSDRDALDSIFEEPQSNFLTNEVVNSNTSDCTPMLSSTVNWSPSQFHAVSPELVSPDQFNEYNDFSKTENINSDVSTSNAHISICSQSSMSADSLVDHRSKSTPLIHQLLNISNSTSQVKGTAASHLQASSDAMTSTVFTQSHQVFEGQQVVLQSHKIAAPQITPQIFVSQTLSQGSTGSEPLVQDNSTSVSMQQMDSSYIQSYQNISTLPQTNFLITSSSFVQQSQQQLQSPVIQQVPAIQPISNIVDISGANQTCFAVQPVQQNNLNQKNQNINLVANNQPQFIVQRALPANVIQMATPAGPAAAGCVQPVYQVQQPSAIQPQPVLMQTSTGVQQVYIQPALNPSLCVNNQTVTTLQPPQSVLIQNNNGVQQHVLLQQPTGQILPTLGQQPLIIQSGQAAASADPTKSTTVNVASLIQGAIPTGSHPQTVAINISGHVVNVNVKPAATSQLAQPPFAQSPGPPQNLSPSPVPFPIQIQQPASLPQSNVQYVQQQAHNINSSSIKSLRLPSSTSVPLLPKLASNSQNNDANFKSKTGTFSSSVSTSLTASDAVQGQTKLQQSSRNNSSASTYLVIKNSSQNSETLAKQNTYVSSSKKVVSSSSFPPPLIHVSQAANCYQIPTQIQQNLNGIQKKLTELASIPNLNPKQREMQQVLNTAKQQLLQNIINKLPQQNTNKLKPNSEVNVSKGQMTMPVVSPLISTSTSNSNLTTTSSSVYIKNALSITSQTQPLQPRSITCSRTLPSAHSSSTHQSTTTSTLSTKFQLPEQLKQKLIEQLSKLTVEQRQIFIKKLISNQQQHLLNSSSTVKSQTMVSNITAVTGENQLNIKPNLNILKKPNEFKAQLSRDQIGATQPDIKSKFKDKQDIFKRLSWYHVYQTREPSEEEFKKADEDFDILCFELLKKKQSMIKKYHYLLLKESENDHAKSEDVFLSKMFIEGEKDVLKNDRKLVEKNPGHFKPKPSQLIPSSISLPSQDTKSISLAFTVPSSTNRDSFNVYTTVNSCPPVKIEVEDISSGSEENTSPAQHLPVICSEAIEKSTSNLINSVITEKNYEKIKVDDIKLEPEENDLSDQNKSSFSSQTTRPFGISFSENYSLPTDDAPLFLSSHSNKIDKLNVSATLIVDEPNVKSEPFISPVASSQSVNDSFVEFDYMEECEQSGNSPHRIPFDNVSPKSENLNPCSPTDDLSAVVDSLNDSIDFLPSFPVNTTITDSKTHTPLEQQSGNGHTVTENESVGLSNSTDVGMEWNVTEKSKSEHFSTSSVPPDNSAQSNFTMSSETTLSSSDNNSDSLKSEMQNAIDSILVLNNLSSDDCANDLLTSHTDVNNSLFGDSSSYQNSNSLSADNMNCDAFNHIDPSESLNNLLSSNGFDSSANNDMCSDDLDAAIQSIM